MKWSMPFFGQSLPFTAGNSGRPTGWNAQCSRPLARSIFSAAHSPPQRKTANIETDNLTAIQSEKFGRGIRFLHGIFHHRGMPLW